MAVRISGKLGERFQFALEVFELGFRLQKRCER